MAIVIGIVFLAIVVGGVAYFRSAPALPFALGAVVTSAVNVVNLYWLKRSLEAAQAMDAAYASGYVRLRGMGRMFLLLAAMVGAGFLAQLEVFGIPLLAGAVFGAFTTRLAAFAMSLFARKDNASANPSEGGDVNV
jgi:hypothetical protein